MYVNPPEAVAWLEEPKNWLMSIRYQVGNDGGHFFSLKSDGACSDDYDICLCLYSWPTKVGFQIHTIPWTEEDEDAYRAMPYVPNGFIGGPSAASQYERMLHDCSRGVWV
jgi:hypothetical protein